MMNDRIQELAKQHGYLRWDQDSQSYELNGDIDEMYSFAELIVRECAKIADDGFGSTNFGNGICGAQVLKHFGVDE
jgi:hypothetical protein